MPSAAQSGTFQAQVFSPAQRQFPVNLYRASPTDVFSRSQRVATQAYRYDQSSNSVNVQLGGQDVTIQYLGEGLPLWIAPVLASLSERWGVGHGWDSYDAKPTELRHAIRLLRYLSSLMKSQTTPPLVTPLADGGLQAEWHSGSIDFEIVVPADEPARFFCYYATHQQEESGDLESNLASAQRIIDQF